MKVAITYDWLNQFGGAERVLTELHGMYPEAPIYTAVYAPERLPEEMRGWDVRPSFLQRVPFARHRHQPFFPLMPMAFEQFDLREYDLVLTTSSACAKGVITAPEALNICYCYTPCRYLWDLYHDYAQGSRGKVLFAPIAHWMRMWDQLSAQRVDHFIAISHAVARRIQRHYRRQAEVIHPPVDVERFQPNGEPPEDYYLVVSRLVQYKRIDIAIEAANLLKRRLIVVGDGPERSKLEALGGPTVEFRGSLSDAEIADLYAGCRAFLFPGIEDFGIAPVEAQAAGRPVIALGQGGALDTVIPRVTGILFEEQCAVAMARAITEFEQLRFDPLRCRRSAERFDRSLFVHRLAESVAQQMEVAHGAPRQRWVGT